MGQFPDGALTLLALELWAVSTLTVGMSPETQWSQDMIGYIPTHIHHAADQASHFFFPSYKITVHLLDSAAY